MGTLRLRAGRRDEARLLSELALRSNSIPGRVLPLLEVPIVGVEAC
jgi:hypothetical protein